jgi:predicted site-specific integrase-resolvase
MTEIEWITRKQLCERLELVPETIRRYVRKGIIPELKFSSKTVRYNWQEVKEALIKQDKLKRSAYNG